MKREKSEYFRFAEHAAELEHSGYLKDAAFAWQCAAQQAQKPANRRWAECRSNWCDRWSTYYGNPVTG